MATPVPGNISPGQEPFTPLDDWDDCFASCGGDELPNLFDDLDNGTEVNVDGALLDLFDSLPNGADPNVAAVPSNLRDDCTNGAGLHDRGDSSYLFDDYPNLNVIDVDVHDDLEFSANCQGALTYNNNNEAVSLPTAIDPGLLLDMECFSDETLLQDSHLASTGPTLPQNQSTRFMNFEPQASWATDTDASILRCFENGTINNSQTEVHYDMEMAENWEDVADSAAAASCLTFAISSTPFGPSHADGTKDYLPESASLAESTVPASPNGPSPGTSTLDPMLGSSMGTLSGLEDSQSRQLPDVKVIPTRSDKKGQHQPSLGWISYDQSSFTENTVAPRPVQTCDLPDNRKRGRREPMTDSKRKKIAEMRQLKSGLLCRMRKKKVQQSSMLPTKSCYTNQTQCDNGTPCRRCLDTARNQLSLLECLRAPLLDLTAAFVPREHNQRHRFGSLLIDASDLLPPLYCVCS